MTAAVVIFGLAYLLLSFQNIPGIFIRRPAAVLIGAVAMVSMGVVSMEKAYRLVDFDTIVFVLGMMIVIGYLEVSGFFEQVEGWILRRARSAERLLMLVVMSSGALSALFMNDTICLMLTPMVARLARRTGLPAAPYLIALATSANIGSAFTPMGNPQNMIVAIHSRIPFLRFCLTLLPLSALGLWLNFLLIRLVYRRRLAACPPIVPESTQAPAFRGRLIYACMAAVAVLLVLLAADVPPPFAAILTAVLLVLAGSTRPRDAFKHIDWELLLMFAGLFVVMGGLRESGALERIMTEVARAAGASLFARISVVAWGSAAVSNVVSNVPCVVFMVNLVPSLGGGRELWLALAAASTIAGNFTLIGSVANLIVFESARDARVGFWEYFRVGAPLSVLLIGLATLWLTLLS